MYMFVKFVIFAMFAMFTMIAMVTMFIMFTLFAMFMVFTILNNRPLSPLVFYLHNAALCQHLSEYIAGVDSIACIQ